jgi:hypothetical protein
MVNQLLILPVGIAISCAGFGWFSRKKHPKAGVSFAVVGFVLRLAGALLIMYGAVPWLLFFGFVFGCK